MKYCEFCGEKIPEDATFCEFCGNKVTQDPLATEEQPAVAEIPEQLQTSEHFSGEAEQVAYGEQPATAVKKTAKRSWPFVILAVLVVGLLAGGGYLWLNQKPTVPVASLATSESTEVKIAVESSQERSETASTVQSTADSEISSSSTSFSEVSVVEPVLTATDVKEALSSPLRSLPNPTGFYFSRVQKQPFSYEYDGDVAIRSASVIKLFILEAFFQEISQKKIKLTDVYSLQAADKVGGTGVLSGFADNQEITYQDLAKYMIVESDNTAGNILIQLLGGIEALNDYIHEQGYRHTRIERLFLDTEALSAGLDNYTSAADVGHLLEKMYRDNNQRALELLRQTKNKEKLPARAGDSITTYNKTGEYADYGVENDACIFEYDGEAYVAVFLSQDGNSQNQITTMQEISGIISKQFIGVEG